MGISTDKLYKYTLKYLDNSRVNDEYNMEECWSTKDISRSSRYDLNQIVLNEVKKLARIDDTFVITDLKCEIQHFKYEITLKYISRDKSKLIKRQYTLLDETFKLIKKECKEDEEKKKDKEEILV